MNSEGCWSTVVCRPEERAALGLAGGSEWLLQCRLGIGHQGNHATDASPFPRHDRRLWLEWNDFDNRAQSLIERNPCSVISPEGAPCVFFAGHGGPHFYVRSNGHAPSVVGAAPGGRPPQSHGRHGAETEPVSEPPRFEPNALDPNFDPNVGGPYAPGGPSGQPLSGPPLSGPVPGQPLPGQPLPGQSMPDPLGRGGAHHLPEGHVPAVPDVPNPGQMPPGPAPRPATEESGYRGGRRSTNAEPPAPGGLRQPDYLNQQYPQHEPPRHEQSGQETAQPTYTQNVHSATAGAGIPPSGTVPAGGSHTEHTDIPNVGNAYAGRRHRADSAEIPLAGVAGPLVDEDRDAAISAALDDVAAALARLSALLRRD